LKRLIPLLVVLILVCTALPVSAGNNQPPAGIDAFRGAWGGTLTHPSPAGIKNVQLNLYFNEAVADDIAGSYKTSGYASITWEDPNMPKRAKATMLPMMARYTQTSETTYDITVLATLPIPPWAPVKDIALFKLEGLATISGSRVTGNIMQGTWYTKHPDGTIGSNSWSVTHLDRRNVNAPEIPVSDPDLNLSLQGGVYACIYTGISGQDGTQLGVSTNIISAAVKATLPTGQSVIVPWYTDIFSVNVDFITSFRYRQFVPGLPSTGGRYDFVLLDVLGNPIPGAVAGDVYVGNNVPQAPSQVTATLTTEGIEVDWANSPVIPNSFDPLNELGFYQMGVSSIEGEAVFGANLIHESSHTIPLTSLSLPHDYGTPLQSLPDGRYEINLESNSVAPAGSAGWDLEAQVIMDPSEKWFFTISSGNVSNLEKCLP
jgi:hypothetical protein